MELYDYLKCEKPYMINDHIHVSSIFRSCGIPVRSVDLPDSHSKHSILTSITEGSVMGVMVGLSGVGAPAQDSNEGRSRRRPHEGKQKQRKSMQTHNKKQAQAKEKHAKMIQIEPPEFNKKRVFRIHVIRASELRDVTWLSSQGNVYCEVTVANKVFRTGNRAYSFKTHGSQVVWNEIFETEYKQEPLDVGIQVFRHQKAVANKKIGEELFSSVSN